jgi:hypothetical protein
VSSRGVVGPFFFEGTVTGAGYHNMLQEYIIPAAHQLYGDDIYQEDGATSPHYHCDVRAYLDNTFPNQWIGHRGSVEYPHWDTQSTENQHIQTCTSMQSAHHPAQKKGILHSLIHHAQKLCDAVSLDKEIQHLKETLKKNCYSNQDIRQALQNKDELRPKQEKPAAVTRLPYQEAASHKVSRLLAKFNIQTVHIPAKNIPLLRPAKDKLGLKTAGIYHIPCECGKVYMGQTGQTIEARLREHRRHVRLNQPERSAVAEHSLTTYHRIDFDGTSKLRTATRYMDRLVREAIESNCTPTTSTETIGLT